MPVSITRRKAYILAAIFTAFAAAIPPSYAENQQDGFYSRKAEGWFWYDDPIEIEEPVAPIPEPPPPPSPVVAAPTPVEPEGPQVFSTAWLRDAMPKHLELAIDDPTAENVRAYMYLQRLMMDKAERFSMATQRTVMGDPFLDESVRRPFASFAIGGLDQKAGRYTTSLVESIAKTAGIFFFFTSDCELCAAQAPLIKNLQDHLGFSVIPVSLDGKNLPQSPWESFKTDNGQAALLNIQSLPATYLASADGEFELIGQSAYALPELKDRILLAARRRDWISQDQFNQTRPIGNFTNIAEILDSAEPANKIKATDPTISSLPGAISPNRLMKYIDTQLESQQ